LLAPFLSDDCSKTITFWLAGPNKPRNQQGNSMAKSTDDEMFLISNKEQFDCLMSARRMDIVDQLANVGAKSIRELAKLVGAKPSALYHHMELLQKVGLIEEAGTRVVNRRQEQLYKTLGTKLKYDLPIEKPEARNIFKRLGSAQCRQTDRDFARGVQSDNVVIDGPDKNLLIFRLVGAPDQEALAKINSHIESIAALMWESAGQDNPLIVLSTMMSPVPCPKGESTTEPEDEA